MAKRNKLCQALDTRTVLVVGAGLLMGFVGNQLIL